MAKFEHSAGQVYRLLHAAENERIVSPNGESGSIPESHLRPLDDLPREDRKSAFDDATARAEAEQRPRVASDVVAAVEKIKPKRQDREAQAASAVAGFMVEVPSMEEAQQRARLMLAQSRDPLPTVDAATRFVGGAADTSIAPEQTSAYSATIEHVAPETVTPFDLFDLCVGMNQAFWQHLESVDEDLCDQLQREMSWNIDGDDPPSELIAVWSTALERLAMMRIGLLQVLRDTKQQLQEQLQEALTQGEKLGFELQVERTERAALQAQLAVEKQERESVFALMKADVQQVAETRDRAEQAVQMTQERLTYLESKQGFTPAGPADGEAMVISGETLLRLRALAARKRPGGLATTPERYLADKVEMLCEQAGMVVEDGAVVQR